MNTKLHVCFAVPLSVAILAVTAVAAQATERHWYKGPEIAKGPHVAVTTKGNLEIHFLTGPPTGKELRCGAVDTGEIWNPFPTGNGEDQVNTLTFSGCKSTICPKKTVTTVTALGLAWHSELFYKFPKEGDEIQGVELEVHCTNGTVVLEGDLAGGVAPGVLELDESMENSSGSIEAEVELTDKIKGPGPKKITIGP
jgi:hypothetical protein